jgi:peptidyl-dipeptidase A
MSKNLFAPLGAAFLLLSLAGASLAATPAATPKTGAVPPAAPAPGATRTAAEASAFVDKVEADLARANAYANRAGWVRANYITDDTIWLEAKAVAELTDLQVRAATEAAHFDGVKVDPIVRRKLDLLKRNLVMPSPNRPGAAEQMATIESGLDSTYSTGKVEYKGKSYSLDDLEEIIAASRDPEELKTLWEGWHRVSPPMTADYTKLIAMANEASVELGYKDTGVLWRSGYDMDADAFATEVDRLWTQVEPLYRDLHCYVRNRLNEKYGDKVQAKTGPIRADLLGNMWAQEWGNIFDVVAPKNGPGLGYDLGKRLQEKGYDALKMFKTAENFYTSLGFAPLPETFWSRSLLTRPKDREVVCHASAWDIDDMADVRIKMCTRVNADDFYTVHHEMGHNIYQRAYDGQPWIFRNGANDGFHEAIGDFAGLSTVTPTYLKQIGLIDQVPGTDADIPYLLRMALDKVAFLPFGLLIDTWRWQVFSGAVTPDRYNDSWWKLRLKYQGILPPGPRPADAFDPGAKYHVAASVPYMRYFLAEIYQFQFYRAACREAGWKGPLNRCSIYMNKDVGKRLDTMMAMGQSKPWPDALEAFTGERKLDASAIIDYFAPLQAWLKKQNKGQKVGW